MSNFFFNFSKINKGYFWGIAEKILRSISAPLIVSFIAVFLDLKSQGYLYMFISLLTIKFLLELGLTQIIIIFVSHEFNYLKIKSIFISGKFTNYIRLKEIFRYALNWFIISSIIFFFIIFFVGFYFFYNSSEPLDFWIYSFLLLCIISSLELISIPFYALKEGIGELSEVYKYKFFRALFYVIFFVVLLSLNYGLWSFPVSLISILLIDLLFIFNNRHLINSLTRSKKKKINKHFKWRKEILPLQFRAGASAIAGLATFSLVVPYTFALLGPEVAGQVGMTIAIAVGISNLSVVPSIISTQKISSLVEQKKDHELNTLISRLIILMFFIHLLGFFSFSLIYYLLEIYYPIILNKMLSFKMFLIYFFSMMLAIGTTPLSIYLRAHKKELLMEISIITGLVVSIAVYFGTYYYGILGGATLYLASFMLTVPAVVIVFLKFRKKFY